MKCATDCLSGEEEEEGEDEEKGGGEEASYLASITVFSYSCSTKSCQRRTEALYLTDSIIFQ